MQAHGGQLLTHFARLAASVAGTSAAVIGVLGRGTEPGPKRGMHGITTGQAASVQVILDVLDGLPGPRIIPDLSDDPQIEPGVFRFAVHHDLISPGGERAGYLCVLDPEPRSGLTAHQTTALGHIASMVMADRQREQRHLHLMHVADRALRVDRMLRLVSEAQSCADALTNLLEALCHFHGAAVGQIRQLSRPGKRLNEISLYHQDHQTGFAWQSIESTSALHELTIEAIQRNKSHAIRFSQLEPGGEAVESGFFGHVCVPIWVQQQRFGISLVFTTSAADLDAVAGDISSLGDTIRPALYQKVTEERIRHAAHHDDLTQLANRLMFQDKLRAAISTARTGGPGFAILCLDLDGFKPINDLHGHGFGDGVLVGVAQRLRESVRDSDTVARTGGDEFAIIQTMAGQPEEAVALAERLLETITRPFELAGRHARIGVSVGIALCPEHGQTPDLLLRNADQALYRAKKAGRKTWCLYDPNMVTGEDEAFLVEQDLKDAIARGDFWLAYQPICDAKSLHIAGFETLLRWRHPILGAIQPDQFIPLAEASGLIIPLGTWVIETACAEGPARLTVNLSPVQFRQPDLPKQIKDILERTGLPANRLGLEVTEGLLLQDSDLVLGTMRALREMGIRIMLDDFGTAYASMSYLRRFPFDGIKIDKSFVQDINDDDVTLAIVQAVLSLASKLNLTVVAEGVETERELNILRKLGCPYIQGYLTGRPGDCHQARTLLRDYWHGDIKQLGADRVLTDAAEHVPAHASAH